MAVASALAAPEGWERHSIDRICQTPVRICNRRDDYFKPVCSMSKPEILQAEVTEMPEIEVEERENVEVPPASSVDFSTEQERRLLQAVLAKCQNGNPASRSARNARNRG